MSNENCCQKQMPMVSVLMSVYNEPEEWMREAIDSILGQTFTDFEFIIVNDNPERKLNREVLSDYAKQDKRIVILENEENIGLTKSLNKGLKVAKGKYIARMDADDISLPERLKKQVDFMENHEKVIVCGTDVEYFGNRNLMRHDWIKQNNRDIKAQMLLTSCFVHPSVVIRHEVLLKRRVCYDVDYQQSQDYRLWERLSDYGEFFNIKERLLKYRISYNQVSFHYSNEQNTYASSIRRRLILKWFKLETIDIDLPATIDVRSLKMFRKYLIQEKKMSITDPYCNAFFRGLYLSLVEKRLWALFYATIHGDIFYFPMRDIYRLFFNAFRSKSNF